jgi:putative inorganic carbon (HCO3(-)) transporter
LENQNVTLSEPWKTPDATAVSPGRRALEWTVIACLMASPLVAPVLLGGSRLWASGPLMALVFLAGLLLCLRALIWRDALVAPPGALAWLGFLAFSAVAIFAYDTPYEARVELLRAASLWAAYWAWSNLAGQGNRWRWVLGLVLLAASVNALYGVVHHFQGNADGVLWFSRAAEGADYRARVSGTYFCPNHWSSLLGMLAPVALALLVMPGVGVALRLLAGYALLTFAPAIHLSQSRAGWIGLAAGLLVTALALTWRRSRILFSIMLVALPLLLAGGVAAYWRVSPAFRGRFLEMQAEIKQTQLGNTQGFRLNQWADTLLMIKDRPWLGHGPGSYRWLGEEYRQHMKAPNQQAEFAHNDYLHSMAEYGAVGLLLLVLPLGWLLLRLLRALHVAANARNAGLIAGLLGAWAAMLAHAAFDFNLRIYANVAVLALLSGVVTGRVFVPSAGAATPRVTAGVGAALMAVLLGVTTWTLTSYYSEIRAAEHLRQFSYDRATQLAERAWRVDAGNWYAAETLGQIAQMRGRWAQDAQQREADAAAAVHWFGLAARGNRLNMETRFALGLALLGSGQVEEGLQSLRQAADGNPLNSTFRSQLGLQLRQQGRYPEALAEFRKAAKIQNDSMIRANIQWLEKKVKKL